MDEAKIAALEQQVQSMEQQQQQMLAYLQGQQQPSRGSSGGGGGGGQPSHVEQFLSQLEGDENLSALRGLFEEYRAAQQRDDAAALRQELEPVRETLWESNAERQLQAAFEQKIVGKFGEAARQYFPELRTAALERARQGYNVSLDSLFFELKPAEAGSLYTQQASAQSKTETGQATGETQDGFATTTGGTPGPVGNPGVAAGAETSDAGGSAPDDTEIAKEILAEMAKTAPLGA